MRRIYFMPLTIDEIKKEVITSIGYSSPGSERVCFEAILGEIEKYLEFKKRKEKEKEKI
jgi:hypothetical protein